MDIIKKLFNFNDDESCAIGLCKFNDDFFKLSDAKEQVKKRIKKVSCGNTRRWKTTKSRSRLRNKIPIELI